MNTVHHFAQSVQAQMLLDAISSGNVDNPVLGVIEGVRGELRVIASLMELTPPGSTVDLGELSGLLDGLCQRLDVALEILERLEQTVQHSGNRQEFAD